MSETHHVPILDEAVRLSDYVAGIFETMPTRKGMKKAIKKGLVEVDGRVGTTGLYIRGGETITLAVSMDPGKPVYELPIDILYIDDYLAVVAKPAGIEVSGNKFRTLENALPFNIPNSAAPDALRFPVAVHRLDFPTSGVLLVARTKAVQVQLGGMFERGEISKTYHAVVIGQLPGSGTVELPIDDKTAHTEYCVLASADSDKYGSLNLVRVLPKTGRRHQIRKHMFSLGCPILGDRQYARKDLLPSTKGLYLHATSLQFDHPVTGNQIMVSQSLPRKFTRIFPRHTV